MGHSKYVIATWWASNAARDDHRYGQWLCPDLGEPACMACGYYTPSWDDRRLPAARWEKARLERAHIVSVNAGGTDEPSNYLLLCRPCHVAAPMTASRTVMLEWVRTRESWLVRSQRELTAAVVAAGVDTEVLAAWFERVEDSAERSRLFAEVAEDLKVGLHHDAVNPGGLSCASAAAVLAKLATRVAVA